MREQTPQAIRNSLLKAIYESGNRYSFNLKRDFNHQRMLVGKERLENEIRYLTDQGYVRVKNKTLDEDYELEITGKGVDYVEEAMRIRKKEKEPTKIPTMIVNNSNISINSPYSTQNLEQKKINKEVISLLKEMKGAVEKKDKNKSLSTLKKIGLISKDIAIGIVSNGIYEYLKKYGL